MRFTSLLFWILLFPAYGFGQDTSYSCCTADREKRAQEAIKKVVGQVPLYIAFSNFPGCEAIIKKAEKLQADSFPCCLTSRLLILDAATILAFAKKEYRDLIPLTTAVLNTIDTFEQRYKAITSPADRGTFALFRLTALQKRYMAYVHTLTIDELDRLEVSIDSLRQYLHGQQSDYEVYYLLSRSQYFQSFKNYKEAHKSVEGAFRIHKKMNAEPLLLIASYNQEALIYYDEGLNDKAVIYCDSALAVFDKVLPKKPDNFPLNFLKAPVLINKGIALTRMNKLNEADTVFGMASRFYNMSNDSTGLTTPRILHNQGVCKLFMGEHQLAYEKIALANQQYINYLMKYMGGLHEDDKFQLLEVIEDAFNALPVLLTSTKNKNRDDIINRIYNEQLTIKGLIFKSQRLLTAALREEKDSANLKLYNEMCNAANKLVKAMQQSNSWSAKELTDLESKRRDCEEKLYRQSAVFKKIVDQLHVSPDQVRNSLKKGEVAIEIIQYKEVDWEKKNWSGEKRYAAIIINYSDTSIRYVPLCLESDIERLFKKVHVNTVSPNRVSFLCYQPPQPNAKAHHLDDSLSAYILNPLLPYISNASTIYISPVGILNRIPFQALSYKGRCALIDSFDIRIVLTTGSLVNRDQADTSLPKTASLWNNINYGQPSHDYIVNKSGWLGTIKSKLDMRWEKLGGGLVMPDLKSWFEKAGIVYYIHDDKRAGEHEFKQLEPAKAEILHLETHGFSLAVKPVEFIPLKQDFDVWQARNPLFFSGLFLAGSKYTWNGYPVTDTAENGILTAYEVAQMDLRKSKLVVLGACETGLGPIKGNEGVYGLGRSFKIAGANKIIVSLWSVPDKESEELFREFYRLWLKDGLPVQQAFRKALQYASKTYKSPFFWSAFEMIE